MREEFAREFPGAGRVVASTRERLAARASSLRRESAPWATVSASGAGFVVSSVTQLVVGLVMLVIRVFDPSTPVTLGWLDALLGTGAAVAVALRVGGPRALAMYLVYLGLGTALQIPGVMTFCERSGFGSLPAYEGCTPVGFLAIRWALWSGIGLGLLLSRAVAARDDGKNLTLRVAGAYSMAWSLVLGWLALTLTQSGDATSALNASLAVSALSVAAAVVAGVVAAMSDHRVRTAAIVASLLVLPWLTGQLPLLVSQIDMATGSTGGSEFLAAIVINLVSTPLAALALVLTAAVADRQRFVPRET